MLLMVGKGIRGETCHAIHWYAKANKKYINDYDENKESQSAKYGSVMSQKRLVNNFEWIEDTSQFKEDFIKGYIEESVEGYFQEVDVQYPEKLLKLHNDLTFLPERMKIENAGKFVTNLHDQTEHVIHMRI